MPLQPKNTKTIFSNPFYLPIRTLKNTGCDMSSAVIFVMAM